jgi:hypothetical protein
MPSRGLYLIETSDNKTIGLVGNKMRAVKIAKKAANEYGKARLQTRKKDKSRLCKTEWFIMEDEE